MNAEKQYSPSSSRVIPATPNKGSINFTDNRNWSITQTKLIDMIHKSEGPKLPAQKKKENKTGLLDNLKSNIETPLGFSTDNVHIHCSSIQPSQFQSLAYAQRTGTHLPSGQDKHLFHKVYHVVQQKQSKKSIITKSTNITQCFYVNSDYLLKRDNDIYISQHPYPYKDFKKCTDTTNKGYRNTADMVLGGRRSLSVLSKYNIINEKLRGDHSYSLSHLIAAEFGGQLKYKNPSENIRYFPETLEYGDWQQAENDLKAKSKKGVLHVIGSDESIIQVFELAEAIIELIKHQLSFKDAIEMKIKLYDILKGIKHVPKWVEFDYQELKDGENVNGRWDNLSEGLTVNDSVPLPNVWRAMKEFGIAPSSISISLSDDTTISTKEELNTFIMNYIQNLKDRTRALNTVDTMWESTTIPHWQEKLQDAISKFQEIKNSNKRIIIESTT